MCGICGMTGTDAYSAVKAMTMAMHHRGPDSQGIANFNNIVIGMTRLAIVDTSDAGSQPMHSFDNNVSLVFNGEIYNYNYLRKLLEKSDIKFHSNCDTEVILNLYLELGEDFIHKLRGMFALALLDRRAGKGQEKLLLARDPFGIKPLLYSEHNGSFIFASEIKAMLASGHIAREIDTESLRLLLTFGSIPQPKTMLSNVFMLEPASILIWKAGKIYKNQYFTLKKYYHLPNIQSSFLYKEQMETLQTTLEESIKIQMQSDVPLGAFLSGGIDSSLLTALMIKSGASDLHTFSVGFEQEGAEIDESSEAFETADFLGTHHHHIEINGNNVADEICNIARALDQPTVDGVNSYMISMFTKKYVTVAISGTGGDELFAGYPWFGEMRNWSIHQKPIKTIIALLMSSSLWNSMATKKIGPWLEEKRMEADFLSRYAMCYYIFGPTGAARLINPDIIQKTSYGQCMNIDIAHQDKLSLADPISRVTALCLRGYTLNQLLRDIDSGSMFHSLEVRVPYLDTEVLKAALALPSESKMAGQPGSPIPQHYAKGLKKILYDIARPMLPENFGYRNKKGFAMPFGYWLGGTLKEVFDECLHSKTIISRGLLNPVYAAEIKKKFEDKEIMWMKPWLLMMIELWCREVLDRK